jgi:DNA-binding NtrC family response regulator
MDVLREHGWPGNLRELISVLRRLSLEGSGTPSAAEVGAAIGEIKPGGPFPPGIFEARRFEDLKRSLEESYLAYLHQKHAGDLERIAAELGTTTRSIYRRFERLGLKPRDIARRRGRS